MPIPPGGYLGFAQMVPAARAALAGQTAQRFGSVMQSRSGGARRRKKAKAARRAGASNKGRKMKFGSPAWQKKYKVGKYKKRRG